MASPSVAMPPIGLAGVYNHCMESTSEPLRVFVYGTLQRGGHYHDEYAAGYLSAVAARTWGRLYDLPVGYPMLVVPDEQILARASADPVADLLRQVEWSATDVPPSHQPATTGHLDEVHGELLTFDDAAARLTALDHLEGFSPDRHSEYHRVLIRTWHGDRCLPAWTYIAPGGTLPRGARHLPHGRWP